MHWRNDTSGWEFLLGSSPQTRPGIGSEDAGPAREGVYRFVEGALSRIKQRRHFIDRRIPLRVILSILLRRSMYAVRGVLKTTLLQFRPTILYVGSGVSMKNAAMCKFGSGVTLETGVMIDGLSQREIGRAHV